MDTASSQSGSYQWPFLLSLITHALVITFVVFQWGNLGGEHHFAKPPKTVKQPKIVQAKAISQDEVMQEVKRLKTIQDEKLANQQEAQRLADLAKEQRLSEERKLKQLKRQQRLAKKMAAKQKKTRDLQHKEQLAKAAAEINAMSKKKAALEQQQRELTQANEKQQRELELQQRIEQEHKQALLKRQQRMQSEIERYGMLLKNKVVRNWGVVGEASAGRWCQLKVRLAPGGTVLDVVTLKSSGGGTDPCRSARAAVYRSSPLPVPSDPATFEKMREVRVTLRANEILPKEG